jgi:hypothetical protein
MDFEYFICVVRSDEEARHRETRRRGNGRSLDEPQPEL